MSMSTFVKPQYVIIRLYSLLLVKVNGDERRLVGSYRVEQGSVTIEVSEVHLLMLWRGLKTIWPYYNLWLHSWSSRKALFFITTFVILLPFLFPPNKRGKKKRRMNDQSRGKKWCVSARSTFLWTNFCLCLLNTSDSLKLASILHISEDMIW